MDEGLLALAIGAAIATVAALEWWARRGLLAHIQLRMHTKAPAHGPSTAVPESGGDDRASRSEAVADAGEPFVDWHGLHRVGQASMAPRVAWETGAVALLRRVLKADLAVAAAYALGPWLMALPAGGSGSVGIAMGLVLALAQLLVSVAVYAVYRRRYRAFDLEQLRRAPPGWARRIARGVAAAVIGLVVLAAGIALAVLRLGALLWLPRLLQPVWLVVVPRLRTLQGVVLVGVAVLFGLHGLFDGTAEDLGLAARLAAAGLLAAGLLHAAILVVHNRRLRSVPGSALLVLRVFDLDAASSYTFNGLIGHWRHFGHHFTVVDPSLVRQTHSHALGWGTRGLLLVALAFVFAGHPATQVLAAVGADPARWSDGAKVSAYLLWLTVAVAALAAATLAVARWRLDGRFIRSREQLLARLARLDRRPRHGDLSFRHERSPCHDDTWFMTVGVFARRARVVLMDLRGFSAERQGCQTEVDYLFDTVPVERIVFLVDLQTDSELVEQMLTERWREQRASSPNLGLSVAMLTLFLAGSSDDKASLQALLDCLIAAAERPLEPREFASPRSTLPVTA